MPAASAPGSVAGFVADSPVRDAVVAALRDVPGLPPVLQSVHILAVAAVVCAYVVPQLKVIGLAAHRQSYPEMIGRLSPWGHWALVVLLLTGTVFVIASPYRYFGNPVVAIKLSCLAAALTLSWLLARGALITAPLFTAAQRALALCALLTWLGVIFAGRWIAYVDYLFWEE